jgi:hypothetical protein
MLEPPTGTPQALAGPSNRAATSFALVGILADRVPLFRYKPALTRPGLFYVDGQKFEAVAPRLPKVDLFRRDVAGLSGFQGHIGLPVPKLVRASFTSLGPH